MRAKINEHLPSYAVVVDALDNQIQGFYEQFGFAALDAHSHRKTPLHVHADCCAIIQ